MEVVGLEDRDWYREEPSQAWRERLRTTSGGRSVRVIPAAWIAIAVSLVISATVWKFDVIHRLGLGTTSVSQPKVVRLSPLPGLDELVSSPRQWKLTDARFGTVTVVVPVGSTPRQAFTNALAERGFQVVG